MTSNEDSFLNLLRIAVPDVEFYSEEEATEFESTEREISASRSDMSYIIEQSNAARNRSARRYGSCYALPTAGIRYHNYGYNDARA